MKRAYGLTGDARKKMVQIIGEVTGVKPEYLRMPSCAYAIGEITVTKDGTMIWDGRTAADTIDSITTALKEAGLISASEAVMSTEQPVITEKTRTSEADMITVEDMITVNPEQTVNTEETNDSAEESPETTGLIISFPLDGGRSGEPITEEAVQNLRKLIASKATLIKKALNADQLDVIIENDKISFPWWNELSEDVTAEYREETPEGFFEITAYQEFLTALVKMAQNAKSVTAVEKSVESEKYAFRTFLLRLGFGGAEHKRTRNILLHRIHRTRLLTFSTSVTNIILLSTSTIRLTRTWFTQTGRAET